MMKKILMMVMAFLTVFGVLADTWTDPTTGITWTYTVVVESCEAAVGSREDRAVPISTSGAISIPSAIGDCQIRHIGLGAFGGCSGLTRVTIPHGMMRIFGQAFANCSGLKSVTIPEGVTWIGDSAFAGCSGLKSVTIPSSVMLIDQGAFYGCSGLTSVTIPDCVTRISPNLFEDCFCLTSVNIPEGVTSIGYYAFSRCRGLTCVTIPKSVTRIEDHAFFGCSGLTSVTIPSGVTHIDDWAFGQCSGLTNVSIPRSVKSIGMCAFVGCRNLKKIFVNAGDKARVKEMIDCSFSPLVGLEYVVLDDATPAKRIGVKQSFEGVVCKVSDGDTIWVKVDGRDRAVGDKNGKVKIRMDRIDAPESDQAFGKAAAKALSDKIAGKRVRVEWKKRDKYGRVVGIVYLGDEDVNLWMVKEGNAWHYSHFDKTKEYAEAHDAAKAKRLGLWRDASPVNPYDWRQRKKRK